MVAFQYVGRIVNPVVGSPIGLLLSLTDSGGVRFVAAGYSDLSTTPVSPSIYQLVIGDLPAYSSPETPITEFDLFMNRYAQGTLAQKEELIPLITALRIKDKELCKQLINAAATLSAAEKTYLIDRVDNMVM